MRVHINGNYFEVRRVGMYIEVTINGDEVWMCEEDEVSTFMRTYGDEHPCKANDICHSV